MEKGKQDNKEGSKMTKAEVCKKTKILVPRAGGLKLRLLKIVRCICPDNEVKVLYYGNFIFSGKTHHYICRGGP